MCQAEIQMAHKWNFYIFKLSLKGTLLKMTETEMAFLPLEDKHQGFTLIINS